MPGPPEVSLGGEARTGCRAALGGFPEIYRTSFISPNILKNGSLKCHTNDD